MQIPWHIESDVRCVLDRHGGSRKANRSRDLPKSCVVNPEVIVLRKGLYLTEDSAMDANQIARRSGHRHADFAQASRAA
jgi:hypothetical protein